MSTDHDLLLLRRDGGVWGVDNRRVSQVERGTHGYRVELRCAEDTLCLAADEVLGVVRDLPVVTGARPVRRFWPQPFAGLAVHGGTPLVVVDPERPPAMLLMTEGETSDGNGRDEKRGA